MGMADWTEASSDFEYRRIAANRVGDLWISTAWFGQAVLEPETPPLIFETTVFDAPIAATEGVEDLSGEPLEWPASFPADKFRYATEGAALAGHREAVTQVHTGLFDKRR